MKLIASAATTRYWAGELICYLSPLRCSTITRRRIDGAILPLKNSLFQVIAADSIRGLTEVTEERTTGCVQAVLSAFSRAISRRRNGKLRGVALLEMLDGSVPCGTCRRWGHCLCAVLALDAYGVKVLA